jgi:hypothetical protein
MDIKNILEHFRMIKPDMTEQEAYDMLQPVTDIISDIYLEISEEFPNLSKDISDTRMGVVGTLQTHWGR